MIDKKSGLSSCLLGLRFSPHGFKLSQELTPSVELHTSGF